MLRKMYQAQRQGRKNGTSQVHAELKKAFG
jgi:hypothetical protein